MFVKNTEISIDKKCRRKGMSTIYNLRKREKQMKKIGIMFLVSSLLLVGCSNSSLTAYVVEKTEQYDKDGKLTSITEYTLNENGIRTGGVIKDSEGKELKKIECTLDDQGKITKIVNIDASTEEIIQTRVYDDRGNLIEEELTSSYSKSVYSYNDQNQWIGTEAYYNGKLVSKDVITVDDKGNRISMTSYDSDNHMTRECTQYKYDDYNNIVSYHDISYDYGTISSESDVKFKNEYEDGLLILRSLENGAEASEYKYDDNGYVIEFHYKTSIDGSDYYSTKKSYKKVDVDSEQDKEYCELFQN